MITTSEYEVVQVFNDLQYKNEIEEIYRMLKDQERRIFDLPFYDCKGNVMDYVLSNVKKGGIFVIKKHNNVCAFFMLEDPKTFGNIITRCKVHIAIRKSYWGKPSREICNVFKDYLTKHYYIKKIIAEVPQCGYGVIKLLKDLGFKHEGTLKDGTMYLDKNNKPKFYDELIYSLTREDI